MTKPWFRMYRREAGTFAQLPFVARAIFREILCLTDDEGMIFVGNKAPAEAVAFALGADRSDRRAIAKAMDLLLADGCLVHDADVLCAPNFPYFQADAPKPSKRREPTSNMQRTDLDGATNEPRTNHEAATTAQRTDHEPTTKIDLSIRNHTLAQSVLSSDSEIDQIRVEGEKSAGARDPLAHAVQSRKPADPMRQSLTVRPTVQADRLGIAEVERMFSELRVAARRGRYSNPAQRDDERLASLAKFANDGGATRAERDAVLRACILGFLGDATSGPRWPLAFLANDPGGFQAMHDGAAPVASGTDPVSMAQAARDRAEKALAEARRHRDSVADGDGFHEAVADFLRKQRALGDADDVLEAAKRRVA